MHESKPMPPPRHEPDDDLREHRTQPEDLNNKAAQAQERAEKADALSLSIAESSDSGTPAAKLSYSLQAGQFATDAPARQLSANIRAQGVASTVLQVSDAGANPWSVVTVGQFSSAEMALSQRNYLANKLGLPPHMPAVLLPPAPAN